jgi:hypothetical protein
MSGKKTLIAISAVLALGSVGAASVAQAGSQGEDRGGFVMPGSMDGVNPVYHPRWFPQYGSVMRAYDRANAAIYSGAGGSFPSATSAYAPARALADQIHRSRG